MHRYSPLAVVNLHQKKAFDNVDRGYLFTTMRAIGFGYRFFNPSSVRAGSWTGRSDKPLNFQWNDQGLHFLGFHLGNYNYVKQNWINC